MPFLTDEDYRIVISDQSLGIIAKDAQDKILAEAVAIEEMSSYLRGRYDVEAIFTAVGTARNMLIVMYCADITVYHLHPSTEVVPQSRKDRYDAAIAWLADVQAARSNPNLPSISEEDEDTIGTGLKWGSLTKNRNNY